MRATSRIIQQLAYRVNETDRPLQLPKDYQYKDAKPRSTIDPATIFGKEVKIEPGDSPADIYARWMTSAENPRFSHVIANRLWKRVMGIGLIEPVDDFKDGVGASNPKLMTFLVDQFVAQNFDMKQYLRMLFNTETYQREVIVEEVAADETYYFPGPILRRLSAEQLWDSLLAMTLPELDARKGLVRNYNRYSNGKELVKKDMKELIAMGKKEAKVRQTQYKFFEKTRDLQKNLRVAYRTQDREKINGLRKEMADIRKEIYGPQAEMMMQRQRQQANTARRETDPRWIGFSRDLVRASEVESPARPGHFLRQFGQSDRETIENANTEATVPQILTLLNGPMFNQLLNRNSVFAKNLANAETRNEKLDVIFLTILSRRPTEREKKITIDVVETDGPRAAADVVWALLNTRQFMFVQ